MRRWFRLNQNKLYRKYIFDPHGFIIRKSKLTRSFKFLLVKFRYNYYKKLRWGSFWRRAKVHQRWVLKYRRNNRFYMQHWRKKIYNQNDAEYNDVSSLMKRNWREVRGSRIELKNEFKNVKLRNWKFDFWNKFKNNYFNFSKKKLARSFAARMSFTKRRKKVAWQCMGYFASKLREYWNKKRYTQWKRYKEKGIRIKKKKLMSRVSPLKIGKRVKRKKTWWLLRVVLKKTAYYYGIKKLQKFRYINNLNNKAMALKTHYNYKLECMLNMVLFRLNIFDNVYISNNYIRTCGILVNNKIVTYPFRFVKVNDIIKFPKSLFKKMFSIFVKRSRYNKSFLFKKIFTTYKFIPKIANLMKNFVNLPPYFEYNYKIMHFIIWRLPNRKELSGANFRHKNSFDWSLNTQLQYN